MTHRGLFQPLPFCDSVILWQLFPPFPKKDVSSRGGFLKNETHLKMTKKIAPEETMMLRVPGVGWREAMVVGSFTASRSRGSLTSGLTETKARAALIKRGDQ